MKETKKPYSRHIYLPRQLADRLEKYISQTYGSTRRILSVIIQQAVQEFLDKREG